MNAEELKTWASSVRPDLPTSRVIDELLDSYRGPGTVYSPAVIAERLHAQEVKRVLDALLVLAGSPSDTLRSHWVFTDWDGTMFDLSPEDVEEVVQTGEFFHPLSGSRIYRFGELIGLVYEAGPGLELAARTGTREPAGQ